MEYVKAQGVTVIKYPYTIGDLRSDNAGTLFAPTMDKVKNLKSFQVYPVTQKPDPVFDPETHYLAPGVPTKVQGAWEVVAVVRYLTEEEMERNEAAVQRKEDRQALRDNASIVAMMRRRPRQIENFIDNNVVADESVKSILKIMLKALAVVARETVD